MVGRLHINTVYAPIKLPTIYAFRTRNKSDNMFIHMLIMLMTCFLNTRESLANRHNDAHIIMPKAQWVTNLSRWVKNDPLCIPECLPKIDTLSRQGLDSFLEQFTLVFNSVLTQVWNEFVKFLNSFLTFFSLGSILTQLQGKFCQFCLVFGSFLIRFFGSFCLNFIIMHTLS